MARGQKYKEAVRQRALAQMAAGDSLSFVAKELGIPRTTLQGWYERQCAEENVDRAERQQRNRERFAEEAWRTIHAGNEILRRRFERAAWDEAALDEMLAAFAAGAETLDAEALRTLLKQFRELQLADAGKVAVVLGTLYDKQALIAKEATANVTISERKFEEL